MKKVLIVISAIVLCFTIFQISKSFGLFETKVSSDSDLSIASWHISVNDNDLTGVNKTFMVDDITYTDSDGNSTDKFAPGVTGSFILVIDPSGTDVSFSYELKVSAPREYSQINIDSVTGINNTTITVNDDTYSRVFPLSEIQSSKKDYIKISFSWDKDNDDESDSLIGSNKESISIPVNINFKQYK